MLKSLAVILIDKIPENSKAIGQDIAYWKRLPEGNDQKTYEYLINAMERYLDRTQMEANQEMRRAAMIRGRGVVSGGVAGGGASTSAGPIKKPCYFYNHGGCKNGNDCKFAHEMKSPEEKAKMEKPVRSGSPPPARSGPPRPQRRGYPVPAALGQGRRGSGDASAREIPPESPEH